MNSSSVSIQPIKCLSEISTSGVLNLSASSHSSSSSVSSKDNIAPDDELQIIPSKSWKRRRSTSLIEWKRAPPIKNTHVNSDIQNLNVLTNENFQTTHESTDYLENDDFAPIYNYNDIKSSRFPTSASTSQLPTSASTPEFPRSAQISRSNSTRTTCSCFSCTIGAGKKFIEKYLYYYR